MSPPIARNKIWFMVLLFALPALLALSVYGLRDIFNFSSKSEGWLLAPPLSVHELHLTWLDNTTIKPDFFAKQWWLIYLTPPACTAACATQIAKLRSVYLALTKNMPRVRRLLLVQGQALTPWQQQQVSTDKALSIMRIGNPPYLLTPCQRATTEGLFIMDPLGNIMLCYAPQQEAHAILQDLEKLLKASRIG